MEADDGTAPSSFQLTCRGKPRQAGEQVVPRNTERRYQPYKEEALMGSALRADPWGDLPHAELCGRQGRTATNIQQGLG